MPLCLCGVLWFCGMAGLLVVVGCDKLPWSSTDNKHDGATATAALTTAQTGVTPGKPTVAPGEVLAIVNGVSISKNDLELQVQELKTLVTSLGQEWKPLTKEQREGILKELIKTELLSQEAVARGLDRELKAQQRWEFLRRGFFAQEWLRWNQERQEVSSAEVEQYYERYKPGFIEPEQRQLRRIVVASEEQTKQALARLLGESMDFTALAQQVSLGPEAKDGGLMPGWVMRREEKSRMFLSEENAQAAGVTSLDPALEAAAFAIDRENSLSNYVKGADNRYHIFQLVKRKDARQVPLTEVWDRIKNALLVQKLQQSITELRDKAKVQEFPERLDNVEGGGGARP